MRPTRTNAFAQPAADLRTAAWDDELCRYFSVHAISSRGAAERDNRFARDGGARLPADGCRSRATPAISKRPCSASSVLDRAMPNATYGTGRVLPGPYGRATDSLEAPAAQYVGGFRRRGRRNMPWKEAFSWRAPRCNGCANGLKLFDAAPAVETFAHAQIRSSLSYLSRRSSTGAPHWVPEARGVLFGLTRGTTGG